MAESTRPQAPRRERNYLRVQDLHQLRRLVFTSKRIVEGQYSGRHASPLRGQSVEFSDYREYVPGDEIGGIDWKVFGRSDKLFIKLLEHQTDMTVNLLVDASASMGYGGRPLPGGRRARTSDAHRDPPDTKYDHACRMAAAIAFLVTNNQDKVGLGIARGGLQSFQPPLGTQSHLYRIVEVLERTVPKSKADLAGAIDTFAQRSTRKGVLVIFSDLLEGREEILRALSRWTHRGSQVIVFQTLHADELELPDLSQAVFIDSETDAEIRLNVDDVRRAYARRFRDFLDGWAEVFRSRKIDHNIVSTEQPYNKALERYLVSRASRS